MTKHKLKPDHTYTVIRPVIMNLKCRKQHRLMVAFNNREGNFQGFADYEDMDEIQKSNPDLRIHQRKQIKHDYDNTLLRYKLKKRAM